MENLFSAWREFRRGKRNRADVQNFEFNLENNLFKLHDELKSKTYRHSYYTPFNVCDPKLRRIHKATVKDRVLHHAVFRVLYPIFDRNFIFDSYSCRLKKGTHRAVKRLDAFARKISANGIRNIFALKCDIRKFFDSISQDILLNIISGKIKDKNSIWLIEIILRSFDRGLPLGNVTSQLFANIYLNELDRFIKYKIRAKFYLRYCDDFIILAEDEKYLRDLIFPINNFLSEKLKLSIHPDKITIRKHRQGIDFLGYVIFPHHRILRTKSRKRIFKKIKNNRSKMESGLIQKEKFERSLRSYLGVLSHADTFNLVKKIK